MILTANALSKFRFRLALLAAIIPALTGPPIWPPESVLHHLKLLYRLYVVAVLTQSEGKLVEALQFGHQGADCVPGLLLQSEVTWVLDGLRARKHRCYSPKMIKKTLLISSSLSSFKRYFALVKHFHF